MWEDSKFIDGYPNKAVVIARQRKGKWYIAGINGENTGKKRYLAFLKGGKGTLIADCQETSGMQQKQTVEKGTNRKTFVEVKPNGVFVLVF